MIKPTITVFINPLCEPCNRLKTWLKEQEIEYLEKDVVNDLESQKQFRSAGGQFTPTTHIEIGDQKHEVIGANVAKIEEILNQLSFKG